MTPDARTDPERLNAVLYHLAQLKQHVFALPAPRLVGPEAEPIGFHLAEAERQVVALFNDIREREYVAAVGR